MKSNGTTGIAGGPAVVAAALVALLALSGCAPAPREFASPGVAAGAGHSIPAILGEGSGIRRDGRYSDALSRLDSFTDITFPPANDGG